MPDDAKPPSSPEEAGRTEFPTYKRGKWWPAFALLIAPFILFFGPLYKTVKHELNLRAAVATLLLFETFMLCAEHYNLKRGHWVYNEARILGPRVFGIPIEEPLIYYWFPPLFCIVLMLWVRRKLRGGANDKT